MAWWHWAVFGLVLAFFEVITPGSLFALFFAFSALVVAALMAAGAVTEPWQQWLLFGVIGVADLVALRRPLKAWLARRSVNRPVDSLVGEPGVIVEEFAAGQVGKVQVRGSLWAARSAESASFPQGRRCRVERVDGLLLWVRAD